MRTLTLAELEELESVIDRGLETFLEVGSALERIRLSKAYRTLRNFKTFAEYVRARFGLGKTRAYELMEASKAAAQIAAQTGHQVKNAAEAQRLGKLIKKLPAETLKETLKTVVADNKKLARMMEMTARNEREALTTDDRAANRAAAIEAAKSILDSLDAPFQTETANFHDYLANMEPESVDLILSDIDYSAAKAVDAEPLSRLAKRVLKPTGMLAVMVGNLNLDKYLSGLCSALPYRGSIAYLMPNGKSPTIHPDKWNACWKPVIICGAAADYIHRDIVERGIVRADDCEKEFLDWQQDIGGFKKLIELLIRQSFAPAGVPSPGKTILDCCCGTGTTLIAGLLANSGPHKVIGCDIDPERVALSKARCKTAWELMRKHRDGDVVLQLMKEKEQTIAMAA